MSVLGIVAEYNPFHNGHKYQIEKAKELSGCDFVVAIMSGNYVQRGEPAIYPKYDRAVFAIENGVDLVIELPVCYSTSTAQVFAYAAIKSLVKLGIIDYISFGCENTDLSLFYGISDLLINEPDNYREKLKYNLSSGMKYAKARQEAVRNILGKEAAEIIAKPNNILAIEYIKALKEFNSDIKIIPVKRCDGGYNSEVLSKDYSSATSIRKGIIDSIKTDYPVPNNVRDYIINKGYVSVDDFNDLLLYKLLSSNTFCEYAEADLELSNKIKSAIFEFKSASEFIGILSTKDETVSHISRTLLHIMLDIKANDLRDYIENDYIFYYNILAASKRGTTLLSDITSSSTIPVINKFGNHYNSLSDDSLAKQMLNSSLFADRLYEYVYKKKYGNMPHNDFLNTIFK